MHQHLEEKRHTQYFSLDKKKQVCFIYVAIYTIFQNYLMSMEKMHIYVRAKKNFRR